MAATGDMLAAVPFGTGVPLERKSLSIQLVDT